MDFNILDILAMTEEIVRKFNSLLNNILIDANACFKVFDFIPQTQSNHIYYDLLLLLNLWCDPKYFCAVL